MATSLARAADALCLEECRFEAYLSNMIKEYNNLRWAQKVLRAQNAAYDCVTRQAVQAAAAPAPRTVDKLKKLVQLTTLNSVRQYQFLRPSQSNATAALATVGIVAAVQHRVGANLLPLGAPALIASLGLYLLVGTGLKSGLAEQDGPLLRNVAAVVSRHGVLGMTHIGLNALGKQANKAGLCRLAQAAFFAAACFCCVLEPLQAALGCAGFALQIPYTIALTLLTVGATLGNALYKRSLAPADYMLNATDLFADGVTTSGPAVARSPA